jgi:glycerol kinase
MRETTALGAAIAAGFAIGVWREFEEVEHLGREGRTVFRPGIGREERAAMVGRWERAVEMCRGWVDEQEGEEEGVKV